MISLYDRFVQTPTNEVMKLFGDNLVDFPSDLELYPRFRIYDNGEVGDFFKDVIGGFVKTAMLVGRTIDLGAFLTSQEYGFMGEYFKIQRFTATDTTILIVRLHDYPAPVFNGIMQHWGLISRSSQERRRHFRRHR